MTDKSLGLTFKKYFTILSRICTRLLQILKKVWCLVYAVNFWYWLIVRPLSMDIPITRFLLHKIVLLYLLVDAIYCLHVQLNSAIRGSVLFYIRLWHWHKMDLFPRWRENFQPRVNSLTFSRPACQLTFAAMG